ncbi:hypothetical protein GGX14DRAFT_673473 [Mycena pura]|uniref:Uncharacterized protein n=1 Tax=Mycena pura TaxID=153505 RepID=A0AAD6UVV3_9AGAR|nr:hypothetical protein GGX14DRAFT_673473 [Mycena pura]
MVMRTVPPEAQHEGDGLRPRARGVTTRRCLDAARYPISSGPRPRSSAYSSSSPSSSMASSQHAGICTGSGAGTGLSATVTSSYEPTREPRAEEADNADDGCDSAGDAGYELSVKLNSDVGAVNGEAGTVSKGVASAASNSNGDGGTESKSSSGVLNGSKAGHGNAPLPVDSDLARRHVAAHSALRSAHSSCSTPSPCARDAARSPWSHAVIAASSAARPREQQPQDVPTHVRSVARQVARLLLLLPRILGEAARVLLREEVIIRSTKKIKRKKNTIHLCSSSTSSKSCFYFLHPRAPALPFRAPPAHPLSAT